jgi:hypothetical protein
MICALEEIRMRIWMTTIVFAIAMMFATTGLAGNDTETVTEATESAAEATPAVETAPPETAVAAPGPIDADADDKAETEED